MKTLLFLSTWFPAPPDNGSKLRVYYLLRALSQQYRVSLLSLAFDTAIPLRGVPILESFCQEVQAIPINPFTYHPSSTLNRFLSPIPVVTRPIPAVVEAVQNLLSKTNYDVIVASTHGMAEYTRLAPANCVGILEEHNSLTRQMKERHKQSKGVISRIQTWFSWQKTRRYERGLLQRHHLITMVSAEDLQMTQSLSVSQKQKVALIPNGVDCRHNHYDIAKTKHPSLIFNGALTYHANYDAMHYFLHHIYPVVRSVLPNVTLTITGSTDQVNLDNLPLDASIIFSGYVPDIRPLVSQSTLCVVPLREGGGTRLKILEAMALGTPIVATPKGAEGLKVQHNLHLLLANTPDQFAQQVIWLLTAPEEQTRLAGEAYTLVQKEYDWDKIGSDFVQLIEHTVINHRRLS